MAYAVSEWGVAYEGKVDRTVDPGQHGFGDHERLYATADGWVYLEAITAAAREAADRLLGTTTAAREGSCAARTTADLLAALAGAGVPAVRADGIAHGTFMLDDEHARAVGASVRFTQGDLPEFWRAGPAVRFGAAPTPLAFSPDNGDQTAAILRELGHDDAFVARLFEQGVTRPVGNGLPT
jgi:crotonobetainyl-CoA:carnitine CoA-transferase CaiB-like acyl-CoA transferase